MAFRFLLPLSSLCTLLSIDRNICIKSKEQLRMRPLIGIPCLPGMRLDNARPIYGNNRAYVHAVENAGGVPVLIPILDDLAGLQALLPRLDGLLLSGGFDIQPRLYGEEPHPLLGEIVPELDALELALARWALEE